MIFSKKFAEFGWIDNDELFGNSSHIFFGLIRFGLFIAEVTRGRIYQIYLGFTTAFTIRMSFEFSSE